MSESDRSSPAVCPLSVACRVGCDRWRRSRDRRALVEFISENPGVDIDSLDGLSTLAITDGGVAEPVEVLETVRTVASTGLLPLSYDDDRFEGLNTLVAWLLSAGTVDPSSHVPYFEVSHGIDYERLDHAFARIGSTYETCERTADGAIVRPRESAPALGRLFLTLGVPEGTQTAVLRVPPYLEGSPPSVRATFVHVYLNNRGRERDGTIVVVEDRSDPFREELASLFGEVCGSPVTVVDDRIVISPLALGRLRGRVPS
jgi:hypothetical protein